MVKYIVAFLLILILSVLDIYLYRIGILQLEPSLCIIPLILILIFSNKNYIRHLGKLNSEGTIFYLILILLSTIFGFFSTSTEIFYSIGLYIMNFMLLLATILYFINCPRKLIKHIFIISFLILGLSICKDIFFSNTIINRGAGFAENPNSAALRIVFLFIILMTLLENKRSKIYILLLSLVFVFLTLSRSGMILLLLTAAIFQINGFSDRVDLKKSKYEIRRTILIFPLVIILFINLIPLVVEYIPAFNSRGTISRIEQLSGKKSIISEDDVGDMGRLTIMKDYFSLFIENPFGYGTSMNINRDFYQYSSHNLLLRLGIDFGVFGIFFYLTFIYRSFKKGIKNLFVPTMSIIIILFIASFFTNTLLENRTFILSLAAAEVFLKRNI